MTKIEIGHFLNSGAIFSSCTSSSSDEIWIGWGDPVRSAEPPMSANSGLSLYAPDFFLKDEKPWWSYPQSKRIHWTELREALEFQFEGRLDFSQLFGNLRWNPPDFEVFQNTFQDLKNQFQSGILKKAVPIVFESGKFDGLTICDEVFDVSRKAFILLNLLVHTKDLPVYLYGMWNPSEGLLGATPEILFHKERGGPLRTVALAGTRTHGDLRGPLLEDPKELEEHQWVIEGIQLSLKDWGKVEVGETRILDLPTLSHLRTPIHVELDPHHEDLPPSSFFEKWVRALHPTPALGAFPKHEGKAWLEKFQTKINRNRFGAPFGIVTDSGDCLCIVGIRNIQWEKNTAQIGAGCGVISASDLNREWRELQAKIHSVKCLMGLADEIKSATKSAKESL